VSIDATVFPDVKRAERGHALLGHVPCPGAQNKVFSASFDIDCEDVPFCGLGRVEIAVMDLKQPARLYRVAINSLAVAGGYGFGPMVLV